MRRSISVPPRYANVLYLEKLRVGSKSVATLAGVGSVARRRNRKATSEKILALCDICRLYHVSGRWHKRRLTANLVFPGPRADLLLIVRLLSGFQCLLFLRCLHGRIHF